MGCASTMAITRTDAMREIFQRLPDASDNTISAVLECLASCNERYNFKIVPSYRDMSDYMPYRYDRDEL